MKNQDDYLWDPSGKPDPELEQLELELSAAQWSGDLPELPVRASARSLGRKRRAVLAVAAAVLLGLFVTRSRNENDASLYRLERLAGRVALDGQAIAQREDGAPVRLGERIETGDNGHAVLHIEGLGQIALEPNSTLAVLDPGALQSPASDHWESLALSLLRLEQGAFRAVINAAPGAFQVDTPAGLSVDLGCVYRAEVRADGLTLIHVSVGRVAFTGAGRKVTVPAGASMRATVDGPPSTPIYDDAHPLLVEAVLRLDRGEEMEEAEVLALLDVLGSRDALTLAHLLSYPSVGAQVFAFLRPNHVLPDGVTREGLLSGDEDMIEAWVEEM